MRMRYRCFPDVTWFRAGVYNSTICLLMRVVVEQTPDAAQKEDGDGRLDHLTIVAG